MLDRKLWNSELPKGIIGSLILEMGMRAQSLQRTQSDAWGSLNSGNLEKEIKEMIEDRDYLFSLL